VAVAGRNESGPSRGERLGGLISGLHRSGGRGWGAAAEMCELLAVAVWLPLFLAIPGGAPALASACQG
jgi:hypothetical protein